MRFSLGGVWELCYTSPETGERVQLSANVPGNAELELEKQGIIHDCMPADQPYSLTPYEYVDDWTYTKTFDAPAVDDQWSQELVLEGIDTIADVYLNQEKIYEAKNMFIEHRVDIKGKLKRSGNVLCVIIHSALLWAREQSYDIMSNARGDTTWGGQTFLRKPRHAWGWDNAPRLLTSGLYRPVYLECLPPVRFDEVYLYTERVTEETVWLGAIWNIKTPVAALNDYTLKWELSYDKRVLASGSMPIHFTRGGIHFTLPRRETPLWWPNGLGDPCLCDMKLCLCEKEKIQATWESKWGIRVLRLDRTEGITPDNQGDFIFVVNNVKVYIRGTNWKPTDAFPSRSDAKVEKALELVRDLNCNMVRIWGGGLYEGDGFFDYCDRNGIMVWQDFMFAGETPTRDKQYAEVITEEATQWIRKLRNHPSLAIWCGDNEDDECLHWNNSETIIRPSDNSISREILKECVLRHDPYRGYVESSPYISDINWKERHAPGVVDWKTRHPKNLSQYMPEVHLYTPVLTVPRVLRESKARFIGETGPYYTCAVSEDGEIFDREKERLFRLWDEPQDPALRNLRMHQTDDYMMSWIQTGKELCSTWFDRSFTLDEWKDYQLCINIISSSVFKEIIEYCRIDRWNKTGVLWWSLMDMWPMLFNYSVVDCKFGRKMPYYWIRQSQKPFAFMIVRKEMEGEIALYAANDTSSVQKGCYEIYALSEEGKEERLAYGYYKEPANSSRMIQRIPENEGRYLILIRWRDHDHSEYQWNHFVSGDMPFSLNAWKLWTERLKGLYADKQQ